MTFEMLIQLVTEIARAVLVDEASERVRKRMRGLGRRIGERGAKSPVFIAHRRIRTRLMNRLHTPEE